MKRFVDLTTRGKLFACFSALLVLLATVIATAHSGMTAILESQSRMYDEDFADLRDLTALRASQNEMRALMLEAQLLDKESDHDPLLAQASDRSKQVDQLILQLIGRARNDPNRLSRIEELKSIWKAFAQTKDAEIIPLIRAGKPAEAQKLAVGVQQERAQRMRAIAEGLGSATEEEAGVALTHAKRRASQSSRVLLLVGIVAAVIGIVLALLMERMIAGPLRTLAFAASRVAAGDLTTDVPLSVRADEVGELIRMFRTMLDNQRRVMRDIHEGVNVLSSSSSEVLATTAQVASSAAETASAVSETTATVEEVKQTAGLSSQKAKYVSESAQKVSQVSQAGRRSVESTVAGMQQIQGQMESIAESIVRLSEQSQAIGEIISTVNDLAEQSNLLAVNAAIEAARAGDQGKGFAVVALEIKSLAEQSRRATAQVRTILGDIQKATSTAVMATEQGSKAVEAGVKQSADTGESIRQLSESVTEAAQAAVQIAASSQQQMVGMDQVALAMENIKQASMQNVSGTRQAEVAAQSLHELGRKLSAMIGTRTA